MRNQNRRDLILGSIWILKGKNQDFKWDLKSGSLTIQKEARSKYGQMDAILSKTIQNLNYWMPFCQKQFKIWMKKYRFWILRFLNGRDHSYSPTIPNPIFQVRISNVSGFARVGFRIHFILVLRCVLFFEWHLKEWGDSIIFS